MPDQKPPFTVSNEEQLTALLNVQHGTHLLAQFLKPCTASEAARTMGEPANRVSYHVQRLLRLGLLMEAGTRGQRRLYQTVATDFYLSPELRSGLDPERGVRPLLDALGEAFLAAPQRTSAQASPGPFLRLSTDRPVEPDPGVAFAPQLKMKIVRLTAQRFREISARLWQEVEELEQSAKQEVGAQLCTLTVLTFPGSVLPMSDEDGQDMDVSFKEA